MQVWVEEIYWQRGYWREGVCAELWWLSCPPVHSATRMVPPPPPPRSLAMKHWLSCQDPWQEVCKCSWWWVLAKGIEAGWMFEFARKMWTLQLQQVCCRWLLFILQGSHLSCETPVVLIPIICQPKAPYLLVLSRFIMWAAKPRKVRVQCISNRSSGTSRTTNCWQLRQGCLLWTLWLWCSFKYGSGRETGCWCLWICTNTFSKVLLHTTYLQWDSTRPHIIIGEKRNHICTLVAQKCLRVFGILLI